MFQFKAWFRSRSVEFRPDHSGLNPQATHIGLIIVLCVQIYVPWFIDPIPRFVIALSNKVCPIIWWSYTFHFKVYALSFEPTSFGWVVWFHWVLALICKFKATCFIMGPYIIEFHAQIWVLHHGIKAHRFVFRAQAYKFEFRARSALNLGTFWSN